MVGRRVAVLFLLLSSVVSAQTADDAWLKRSAEILSHPEQHADPALRDQAAAAAKAAQRAGSIDAIAADAERKAQVALQAASPTAAARPPEAGRHYRLFLSQSVPVATLDAALRTASQFHDVSIVYRGAKPDQALRDVIDAVRARIQALPKDMELPAIEIDPPRFSEARIETVPALIAYDDGVPVAWARGTTSVEEFERRWNEGARGDLGKLGPTYAVLERDFMDVMKERAAKIDVAALQAKAMTDFWAKRDFVVLPTAREARTRSVDPSIEVTADIVLPDGKVLAHAGDRINPLKTMPFTQRLVIFDATDSAQLAAVKPFTDNPGRRITLMTTQVDRSRGWEQLKERGEALGAPVRVLTPILRDRFHLERVPTIVEATGDHFTVTELAVPLDAKEPSHAVSF